MGGRHVCNAFILNLFDIKSKSKQNHSYQSVFFLL